jgi:hypothetical protein
MRRALAIVLVAAAGAATGAAPAGAATVQTMVVGKDKVLRAPRAMTLRAKTVRVGSKRCAVARNTPLAALLGTGLRVRLRDYGSCGRRTRDSGSLFVTQVGSDRNRGPRRLGLQGRAQGRHGRRRRPGRAVRVRRAARRRPRDVVLVRARLH